MKIEEAKAELLDFLSHEYKKPTVVTMPDFFFDRIITLNYNVKNFSRIIEKISSQKGGALDNTFQMDLKGGNAINTTASLAALGAKVTPIVCTNKKGIKKIKKTLKKYKINLSHIKIRDRASITTALELIEKNQKINIMLRDLGDLENFQTSDLNEKDELLIKNANYVCIFNWAGTKNYGSKLAKKVFAIVKKLGKGITYYDTADPNSNKKKIPELIETVLKSDYVDILSLNENEAITYASIIDNQIQKRAKSNKSEKLPLEAAKVLVRKLNSRIDLHTSKYAATITKKKTTYVQTFKIKPSIVTGAGDSWNAGNIIGDMNCLTDKSRLILANAVSACYLLDSKGKYPTKKILYKFIKKELTKEFLIQ